MALYESIAQDIIEKIEGNRYKPGERLPTESELMQTYNASRVTIRKALGILILKDMINRSPKKGTFVNSHFEYREQKHVVLVMLLQAREALDIIRGIEECFLPYNVNLTTKFSNCSEKSEREIIESLLKAKLDGLIIYPSSSNMDIRIIEELNQQNIPLVFIDKAPGHIPCNLVSVDNFNAARMATDYFLKRGHRQMAFLAQTGNKYSSVQERLRGFCSSLQAHGTKPGPQNVILRQDIEEAIQFLLSMRPLPTAVLCENDSAALNFSQKARAMGYRLPEDLSVIGFDDIHQSACASPPLTTIRQPFCRIGQTAGTVMLDQLFRQNQCIQSILLPADIVERDSVQTL